jgi:hypothetical protein
MVPRRCNHTNTVSVCAGQGVVQFAQAVGSSRAFMIRFCVIPSAFNVERMLYADPALKGSLPKVADICPNEDGAIVDARGHPLPPCIVMERGEALDEWAIRCEPEIAVTIEVCGYMLCFPYVKTYV